MCLSCVFRNLACLSLLCAAAAGLPPDPQKLMVFENSPSALFSVPWNGGMCFAIANDYGECMGVFRTDGTVAGSGAVVFPGKEGNYAEVLASDGRRAYFAVSGSATPWEGGWSLWCLDAETGLSGHLGEIAWASNSTSRFAPTAIVHRGVLYFGTADGELWVSDGTLAGTGLLKAFSGHPSPHDPSSGRVFHLPGAFIPFGDRVLFNAYDEVMGYTLWVTDGTAGGTVPAADLHVAPPTHPEFPSSILAGLIDYGWAAEGMAFLSVMQAFHSPPEDPNLSFMMPDHIKGFLVRDIDGAATLTEVEGIPISPVERIDNAACGLFLSGENILKTMRVGLSSHQATTHVLSSEVSSWMGPSGHVALGGRLFCGLSLFGDNAGWEVYAWNPADNSLSLLKDICEGSSDALYEMNDPRKNAPIAKSGGYLYFKAVSLKPMKGPGPTFDTALWRTDGTPEGTVEAVNYDGTGNGNTNMYQSTVYANGGRLFFLQKDYRPEAPAEERGKMALWMIDHNTGGGTAPQAVIYGAASRVAEGSTVTLRAGGEGFSGYLSYEWFFNGEPLGVYTATLTLTDVTAFNAGAYTVRIYDDSKAVHESAPFVLEVLAEGALPVGAGAGLAVLLAAAGALTLRRRRMGAG